VQDGVRARPVAVGRHEVRFLDTIAEAFPSDLRSLIVDWPRWRGLVLDADVADHSLPVEQAQWLPPVVPRKLLCVGTNYRDHVREMDVAFGMQTPDPPFPYSFQKPPTSLVGSGATVPQPSFGKQLDWEVELAVVIGDPGAAKGPDPLRAVFGYSILNDLSLRDYIPFPHVLGLDALVAKGFDGAAPMGPWITLAEHVADPGALKIGLSVNGEVMQDSSTAEMIFDVPALITHYARILTLEPGDVIATGTPAGVGAGRRPPRFLAPGDRVRARIEGLGELDTTIAEPAPGGLLTAESEASA
jgi:2,4-diketo-3-deoxy-L-fuconate hydrolase